MTPGDTVLSIQANAEMVDNDCLWLLLQITLSAADYVYVDINQSNANANAAGGYTPSKQTFDDVVVMYCSRSVELNGDTIPRRYGGAYGITNQGGRIRSTFESINLKCYAGETFESGTVEVWGWA